MQTRTRMLTVLLLGGIVTLLLALSAVTGAGKGPPVPLDLTPTVYVYVPFSAKQPTPTPTPTPIPWRYERECESRDRHTVGKTIWRSRACRDRVHGQFGCEGSSPWGAKAGFVEYGGIQSPRVDQLYLRVRYSKYSYSSVAICVYVDDETEARACFTPQDQWNWNRFAWTEPIRLGSLGRGTHTIRFQTTGQTYGVADLDRFVLADHPPEAGGC